MQRLQMFLHVMMVLHLAAAFSSDQERLSGKPLSDIVSNIRGAFQSKLKISSNDFSGSSSKPKSRPTVGLLDAGVTGYYIDASYASDSFQCRVLESGKAYRLNSCVVYGRDNVIFTATATKVLMTTYRDAGCQTVEDVGTPFTIVTDCNFFHENYYVSESTQIPSSTVTVQFKTFAAVDTSCSAAPEYGNARQLDTCTDSTMYTVSGDAVVISTYDNSLCTDAALNFKFIKFGECNGNSIATLVSPTTTSSSSTVVRSHMNSYILPFFSGMSSVSESSIEYFTDSVNSIISGFNIDFHFYNLLLIAMGTIVSCVAVKACIKKKSSNSTRDKNTSKSTSNSSTCNSNIEFEEIKKQIQMLIEQNKDGVERHDRIEEQLRHQAMTSKQQRGEELIIQHAMYARQKRIEDQLQEQTYTRQQLIEDQPSRTQPLLRIESTTPIGIENQEQILRLQSRMNRLKCPDGERRNRKTGECEKKRDSSHKSNT